MLFSHRRHRLPVTALVALPCLLGACSRPAAEKLPELSDAARNDPTASTARTQARSVPEPGAPQVPASNGGGPYEVNLQDEAMGTNVHFIAYTNDQVDTRQVRDAMSQALGEIKRLEGMLSEWRSDSDVGKINLSPDQWVKVGPEAFAVIARGLEAGRVSQGEIRHHLPSHERGVEVWQRRRRAAKSPVEV